MTENLTPSDEDLGAYVRAAVKAMMATGIDELTGGCPGEPAGVVRWAFLAIPDGPERCVAWDGGWLDDGDHKPCETCRYIPRLTTEEHRYIPPPRPAHHLQLVTVD